MVQKKRGPISSLQGWWRESSVLKREVVALAVGVVVLAGVGFGLWQVGRGPYREWQKRKAVEEARARVEAGDHRGALLAFRRATQMSPGDIETWREVAEFLAGIGSGEVLVARKNLVRLAPEDTALRVALVAESLRQGATGEAREQLRALDEEAREDADYHRMAAALALMLGRTEELEGHLEALVAAEPGDLAARHNLAALRLWGVDEAKAKEARAVLMDLLGEREWRVRAGLELLKAAGASGSPAEADRVVAAVVRALNPAGAAGVLARVEPGEPPGWAGMLEALRGAAAERSNDAAAFAVWWSGLGAAREAEAWLGGLPAEIAGDEAVRSVRAGLLVRTRELAKLDAVLQEGAWGPVRREVLSLAMAARLQAEAGARSRADGTWGDAVGAAGERAVDLRVLARLAGVWGEAGWSVQAMWPLAEGHARERWVLDALRVLLATRRDTEGLWRLYSIWAVRAPEDTAVVATWVMLGALLDRMNATQVAAAERLRTEEGLGAALAVVAADWRRGRTGEAAAGLARLGPEAEGQPKVDFWRAVVSLQAGDVEAAEGWLKAVDMRGWLDAEVRLGEATRLRIREARRAEDKARREAEESEAQPAAAES
jgi:thioredoxin-like negative regulator of GroEL